MTCIACAVAEVDPGTGLPMAKCRQCTLREILRSPEHAASAAAGKLLPAYVALLAPLGDPVRVHVDEIKPMVKAGLR